MTDGLPTSQADHTLLSAGSHRSANLTLPPMDRTISSTSSAYSNPRSPSPRVTLHLIHQFSYRKPRDSFPLSETISAKRTHTIVKVKHALHRHLPGAPKVDGIRLIHSGRVLLDHQTIAEVVAEGQSETHLHIVVRPDAWLDLDNAPLTPTGNPSATTSHINAPLSQRPNSTGVRSRPSVDPLEGSSYFVLPSEMPISPYCASSPSIVSPSTMRPQDVMQMESLPRVLSISYVLYYQRYDLLYSAFERQASLLSSPLLPIQDGDSAIERLYRSLGLTNPGARKALSAVEKQIFGWSVWEDGDAPPDVALLDRLLRECCQRLDELRLMLQQMEDVGEPVRAELQGGGPPQSMASVDAPSQQTVQLPPPAVPAGRPPTTTAARAPRIPPPTPMELLVMMLPVAFLAVKLAVLLYIFTRGASPTKKWTMYGITYLWIAFEMLRAWRRRVRRLRGSQRRAARSTAGQQGGQARRGSRHQSSTSQRVGQSNPANSSGTGVPVAPRRFTITSPSQPRFWLQRIAFLGMEEEDLELGFRPSSSQAHIWLVRIARERSAAQRRTGEGRGLLPRKILAKFDLSKVINGLSFPIVLYLATLIPEVEELRMEEVRKRDRLIRKWWSERGSKWIEEKRKEEASRRAEQQQDHDKGESSSAGARQQDSRSSSELPRLLKHPYVLSLLSLKLSPDGLVQPLDSSSTRNVGGDRIDIQEELDAMRALQRRAADPINEADGGGGDAAGGNEAEEGHESDGVDDERAAEGAEDDFGFF